MEFDQTVQRLAVEAAGMSEAAISTGHRPLPASVSAPLRTQRWPVPGMLVPVHNGDLPS